MRRVPSLVIQRARALRAARAVKLLVLDVDGVLTDGHMVYDQDGRVSKKFHAQDGLGIKVAQANGLRIGVVSGLDSPAVRARVEELQISDYHPGHRHKVAPVLQMCDKHGLSPMQVAFLGDDWVDAAVMSQVGLPMTVPLAQPETSRIAMWTATAQGGYGAVREAIRFIMSAQNIHTSAFLDFTAHR